MKFDLRRLPVDRDWWKARLARVSPGSVLFGACLLFGGIALVPFGQDKADAAARAIPRLPLHGPASAVLAGDALVINGAQLQLWGVTAPRPGSAEGEKAHAYLAALVSTHPLTCEDTGQRSYTRTVARCFDPWNRDVAELMVRAGWAYDQPAFSQGQYASAGQQAQTLEVGSFRRSSSASAFDLPFPSGPSAPIEASPAGAYVVPRLAVPH